jgi:bifunctional enzyme CysN/CysC
VSGDLPVKGARSAAGDSAADAAWGTLPPRSLLRFNTCASVDDGKSTLIGRLLWDSRPRFAELRTAVEAEGREARSQTGGDDYARFVDGLAAGREPGTSSDVAYRFFATERRSFIVADSLGHEQYTRNLVTGASTADLSVILVDARKGVLTQTKRHSFLVFLLGVRHVVLAVNKMDLVDYSKDVFAKIEAEYRAFATEQGLPDVTCIPISAVKGDNLLERSEVMGWYHGPTLLEVLENVESDETRVRRQPLRLPVQWVNRPSPEFCGFAGTIVAGGLRKGDLLRVQPSGHTSRVTRIVAWGGDLEQATAGQSITITLADNIDVSRGDLIVPADHPAEVSNQFEATVVWLHETPLLPGRSYLLKIGARSVTGTVAPLKHRINLNTRQKMAAAKLDLNEIGVCNLQLDALIPFDPYQVNRDTGGFILIDRITNDTVGAGMLHFALRRAANIHWQALDVNKAGRAAIKGQKPCVLWFTGLSGAGKSTIANLVDNRLHSLKRHTYLLDGENIRHGLSKNLGFTDADRVENIRRIAEVAKLMVDAGLIVSAAFISPFRAEREMARGLLAAGEFIEIFVATPLHVAEQRDPKGLYKKARSGALKNFTGIDSPYEPPENPELVIDTTTCTPEEASARIVAYLKEHGILEP